MVQIKGINVPVVTPFKNNEINEDGFRTIINYLIENKVHGIIPCGSTGETINLRMDERKKVAEIAIDEASGRISVIVGTGDSSTDRAIELTEHAADIGADAVLLVTPFYFKPSQEAIYEYFSAIVSTIDIPILLYMVPKFTGGVEIDPQTVVRLQEYSNIIGIKMSITDIRKISTMINIASNESFNVFAGSGSAIFATLMLGGIGAVPATGNIATRMIADIYGSFVQNDFEKARELQLKILPLDNFLTGPNGHGIPAIKVGMDMLDLDLQAGIPRSPLLPITDKVKNELGNILHSIGLIENQ
ncbi:4-hydroxy-tetrahydrodipicolinate synthase [Candidatus Borrarchaeum sp.]|uniref:4-hydroxy-tetrahydrodipicolinate synthase n=1 Tax=Candidatus Borrarchaeum sp. TaxID=2846742 RepID=UPI00257D1030|nr:4-hydroxy-tetrahydrodipicolinate synthase [Candidatus Borrarchaeum sp.]